jgi:23S rRNA pseudouridine2605 synthase
LQDGVGLEDGPAQFESIRSAGGDAANQWFHVVVREGRNRLVRRLWESQGVTVSRLIRVRFGDVLLPPRLRTGGSMELEPEQIEALMASVGLSGVEQPTDNPRRARDERSETPRRSKPRQTTGRSRR